MWTFPLVPSFISFRQPHNSCHDWFHHVILKSLSSSSLSSLSAFIAPSLFHSRLKTYVFHNPSHHNRLKVPPLTVFTGPDVACSLVYFQFISTPPPVSTAWPVTRLLRGRSSVRSLVCYQNWNTIVRKRTNWLCCKLANFDRTFICLSIYF